MCLFALLAISLGGCASQYYHPIKKTAEFYDDLAYCTDQAEHQGMEIKGAARDRAIDQCLVHLGWRDQDNMCFSRRFQSRMPASDVCKK